VQFVFNPAKTPSEEKNSSSLFEIAENGNFDSPRWGLTQKNTPEIILPECVWQRFADSG